MMKAARQTLAWLICQSQTPFGAALLYAGLSTDMVLLNKLVLTKMFFSFPTFIMALQMVVTVLLLELARLLRLVQFANYSRAMALATFPVSLLYVMHAYFSLSALDGLNVPLYTTIKHCSPAIVFALNFLLQRQRPQQNAVIVVSVVMMPIGAYIAAKSDIMYDYIAFTYALIAIGFQFAYLAAVENLLTKTQYSVIELLYCTALHGQVFFVVVGGVLTDEFLNATDHMFTLMRSAVRISVFIIGTQILLGVGLCLASFNCVRVNGATAVANIAVAKVFVQIPIGYLVSYYVFEDIHVNGWNLLGLLINITACVVYTLELVRRDRLLSTKPLTNTGMKTGVVLTT